MSSFMGSPPSPRTTFTALAPEIKQLILWLLPDVSSLLSVLLTCSSLYHSVGDAKSLILTKILQGQIHSDTAFDAYIASRSFSLDRAFECLPFNPMGMDEESLLAKPWSLDKVREILLHYDGDRSLPLSQRWELRDALALSRLHQHVQHFARGFASVALCIDPTGRRLSGLDSQPSSGEIHRIERTLYRFEIFCNLFRARERRGRPSPRKLLNPEVKMPLEERNVLFFSRFPPWENEQLACIRDYLFDQVTIPYNDVAEHKVEWAADDDWDFPYYDDWDSPDNASKEHVLCHGLSFIRKLVETDSFDERCRLLGWPHESNHEFLFSGLDQTAYKAFDFETQDYNSVDFGWLCASDDDNGPKEAWSWAHVDSRSCKIYNHRWQGHRFLRQRGYVMWDKARWECWRLFDKEWQEDPPVEHDPEYSNEEDKRRWKEIDVSFKVRHLIYKLGGRGYWALGDETQVQWPQGMPPEDWPSKRLDVIEEHKALVKVCLEEKKALEVAPKPERKVIEERQHWPSDYQGWRGFFEHKKSSA